MSIILLILCITFYRFFISFTELHRLNNSLINKEDLLVIINQDNFSSRSIGLYRNPLRYFKNYNIEKIINNLVIRSKNVSFISYDCIRYNLVRLKGYKNVGYVILTNNNELNSIRQKVVTNKDFKDLSEIIYPESAWRISDCFHKECHSESEKLSKSASHFFASNVFDIISSEVLRTNKEDDDVGLYGRSNNQRILKYIKSKYVVAPDNANYYKILLKMEEV